MIWQSNNIVLLMKTPVDAIEKTAGYVLICSARLPFIITYNVIAAILRGVGDSKTPMYFIGVSCVVNVAGDIVFVGVFHMGVAGAAAATVLTQTISSLCGIIYLIHHGFSFAFGRKEGKSRRSLKPQENI